MPHSCWISQAEEKIRYLQHNNKRSNKGYVEHLLKVVTSVEQYVSPKGTGLDFGSGPSPVLGEILREAGFSCVDYDPIFYPSREFSALRNFFDFVVTCEAAEHFKDPLLEWKEMVKVLKPGGVVIVSTKTVKDQCSEEEFLRWWYIRDATHISFYSKKSVELLARQLGVRVKQFSEDGFVVIKNEITT